MILGLHCLLLTSSLTIYHTYRPVEKQYMIKSCQAVFSCFILNLCYLHVLTNMVIFYIFSNFVWPHILYNSLKFLNEMFTTDKKKLKWSHSSTWFRAGKYFEFGFHRHSLPKKCFTCLTREKELGVHLRRRDEDLRKYKCSLSTI